MTGSASRVAVCIGRKNATTSLSPHDIVEQPLLGEIHADDVGPGVDQPRRRGRQPEGLPSHVVGGDEKDRGHSCLLWHAESSLFELVQRWCRAQRALRLA